MKFAVVILGLLAVVPASAQQRTWCPHCVDPLLSVMDNPEWWRQNPVALRVQLQACRDHTGPYLMWCRVATQAAAGQAKH